MRQKRAEGTGYVIPSAGRNPARANGFLAALGITYVAGFTLIELLLVIAISAVLAAILFPVFVSAREHARQVKCVSNLKQLAFAFLRYADDNGDRLPATRWERIGYFADAYDWTGQDHSNTPGRIDLQKGQVWRYIHSKETYICPSDKGRPAKVPWKPNGFPLSYSMNHYITTAKLSDATGRLTKLLLIIHRELTRQMRAWEWALYPGQSPPWP